MSEERPPDEIPGPPPERNATFVPLRGNPTLEQAWQRFALYNQNSIAQQSGFRSVRSWIIYLGVAATFLAVLQTALEKLKLTETPLVLTLYGHIEPTLPYVHFLVIVAPITVGILTAGVSKIGRGVNWVLLRGSAESLKRETYLYRARVGAYRPAETREKSADAKLAEKIEEIGRRMLNSEVAQASLESYEGPLPPEYGAAPGDDGFSELTGKRYIEWRLVDQLDYYRGKSAKLDKQLQKLQWTSVALGGAGTLLAAYNQEIWVPVTMSLIGAMAALLELQNVETVLGRYARAAMDLDNVLAWWSAIPPADREDKLDLLIARTETILQSETAGWQEEMQELIKGIEAEERDKAEGRKLAEGEKKPVSPELEDDTEPDGAAPA